MKYMNNENAIHDPNGSARCDRGTLLQRRALILGIFAIPCLLIIVGLGLGTLTLPWIPALPTFAFCLSLVLIHAYFLKDNYRLRMASMSGTRKSVMKLDEREKLVIDQAFRTSYRIFALVCFLLVWGLFINIATLHLAYRLGFGGSFCIYAGVTCLLFYLPTTLVAWHESVWM